MQHTIANGMCILGIVDYHDLTTTARHHNLSWESLTVRSFHFICDDWVSSYNLTNSEHKTTHILTCTISMV